MKLLALALAPAIAIIVYILKKDRYNKEPLVNLLVSFVLGMLSTIPAIILQMAVKSRIDYFFENQSLLYYALFAFGAVALTEEGSKYFMLRRYAYRRREFDEPLDGIIYGVMVSMGFASVENVLYVFQYGFGTGVMRMFLAVPAHGCFGALMGYYLGLAKFDKERRRSYLGWALGIAVIFHGTYDFLLFIQQSRDIAGYFPEGLLSMGAVGSLYVAVRLSRKAITLHQEVSRIEYERLQNNPVSPSLNPHQSGLRYQQSLFDGYRDNFDIRHADADDMHIVQRLANKIWPQAYKDILSPGQIEYMMNMFYSTEALAVQFQQHRFILAYRGGEPHGFASFSRSGDTDIFKLHKIYVDSGTRSWGLGTAMIAYIVQDIRSVGGTTLELNVNRENSARHFYEKKGFEVIREEDIEIGNGYHMNDYVMRLNLSQS